MVSKVNLKARIDRHSRIFKDNIGNVSPFRFVYYKWSYNVVVFWVVLFIPFYPLFSSFFYDTSAYDFYRGDIDESSIIDSYEEGENKISLSDDSYLSINTLSEWSRDVSGYSEVIDYEVKSGDSMSLIASKFGVSTNSILWANNFDIKKTLHPGEKIKIPPVSGVIHDVKSGETLWEIAKKYKVDLDKILAQNALSGAASIKVGQTLIIPGAIKETPKPQVVAQKPKNVGINKNTQTQVYTFTQGGLSEFTNDNWVYQLVKRAPQWTFYGWNCTWFVAQYKNVNWSGNANQWLRNAQAKWVPTGSTPWLGSIVVFNGKWYNPVYWHVAIVVDITANDIIVKDMNYRRLYEVTTRKVPKNDRAIMWYIYVD